MANANRYKKYIIDICEDGHRTAEQVKESVSKQFPRSFISIGTVYRNLTELVNEGELMKIHGLMDKMIYEKKKPHHGHIYCKNSGTILDIDVSLIPLDSVVIPDEFCNLDVQITFAGNFNDTDIRYCNLTGKKL